MTVVLLSGGVDSCVLATHLAAGSVPVTAIGVNYGQRHRVELAAAAQIAATLDIDFEIIDAPQLGGRLSSALTNPDTPVPHGHYAHESMAATVVPGRNLMFASMAIGIAASTGHDTVALAVHAGDHPIYPDCRPEFTTGLDTVSRAAYGVGVDAPFVKYSKTEIVALGHRLDAPMGLSWSCYEGGDTHCGACGTCVERAEAFRDAGVPDPTVWAAVA